VGCALETPPRGQGPVAARVRGGAGRAGRAGRRIEGSEVAKYEESSYYPRVPTFAAMARVLGVSMEALLFGEEAGRITA